MQGAEKLDRIFKAISHSTRREILRSISGGQKSVLEIAERHPISINGVSKHLKTLEAAGLIEREIVGTTHLIRLRAKPLRDAMKWLNFYEEFWDQSLLRMKRELEK